MIPRRLFWILDVSVVGFAYCLAYALLPALHSAMRVMRLDWLPEIFRPPALAGELPPLPVIAHVLVLVGFATVLVLEFCGAYRPLLDQSRARVLGYSILAPVSAAGVVTLVLFFEQKTDWSRLFLLAFIALGVIVLFVFRMSLRHYLMRRRDAGFYRKNVLLVGPRSGVRWLVGYFGEAAPSTEYKIVGYLRVADDSEDIDPTVPLLGDAEGLGDALISSQIDEVIAVQSGGGAEWMPSIIETCDALGILLRIIPQALLFGKIRTLRM